MSENYAVHICRTATCKAMKRTGTMVLLSSHSPGWNRDHAMGAAAGDPRGGERPMELKAFSRKTIWFCISSSKYGKKNCPHSKGIPEEVLESAFVESYRMITNDHKDVLEEFLQRTEEELHSDATMQEIERVKKELKQLDQKMQRLLDMHLEEQIDFGTYEDKKLEIIKEQQLKTTELKRLQGEADVEKDLRKRLDAMRKLLSEAPILKEFDRNVFESIVEKVIVGGYDDEGNADPSMITFVYKTGFEDKKNGDDFKPPRRNSKAKKLPSLPKNEEDKLSQLSSDEACGDGLLIVQNQICPTYRH